MMRSGRDTQAGRKTKEERQKKEKNKNKEDSLKHTPNSYLFFPSDNPYPGALARDDCSSDTADLGRAGPGPSATSGDSHRQLCTLSPLARQQYSAGGGAGWSTGMSRMEDGADSAFTGVSTVPKAGGVSSAKPA